MATCARQGSNSNCRYSVFDHERATSLLVDSPDLHHANGHSCYYYCPVRYRIFRYNNSVSDHGRRMSCATSLLHYSHINPAVGARRFSAAALTSKTILREIRDAILTCARKPTRVSLIYRTLMDMRATATTSTTTVATTPAEAPKCDFKNFLDAVSLYF